MARLQVCSQVMLVVPFLALLLPVRAAVTGNDTRVDSQTVTARTHPESDRSTPSNENSVSHWRTMAKSQVLERVEAQLNKGVAKNVILFLGDGMSVTTLTAARIYLGQLNNESGESGQLSFEKFPFSGFSKTYCVDAQVADSACSSVAYLGGVKANTGTLGVTASVARGDCAASLVADNRVDTVLSWAQAAGKATGIVTTTTVTHASPAGNYAHSAERDWESDADMRTSDNATVCDDIAAQLVNNEPGKNCQVILGGGRAKFLPKSSGGERLDGDDLVAAWRADKAGLGDTRYVTNREELLQTETVDTDYLLGLFQEGHMKYHLEEGSDLQPTLAEMTEVAIKILSKRKEGFYLFVEGGRIDHGHHKTWARRALDETVELHKAVKVAVDMVDEKETLLVVTADHAHTLTLAGYPARGSDILGLVEESSDHLVYTTLSYANGPSAELNRTGPRRDISNDNITSPTYRYPSLVPLKDETHGGEDVAVYARGPWAHLFSGNYEQSLIPHVMAYAAQMGPLQLSHGHHSFLDDFFSSSAFLYAPVWSVILATVLLCLVCS